MIDMGHQTINTFFLRVEKDHQGYYRGNQALDSHYHGWHYHVEHSTITQKEIMRYFQYVLKRQYHAKRLDLPAEILGIGYVNGPPGIFSVWEAKEWFYQKGAGKFERRVKSCVLWIGKFGKLHIEANKVQKYVYSILKKAEIVGILRNLCFKSIQQ